MNDRESLFAYFLFNRNMPRSDNGSCRLGLRLDLVSKTELANIGQYFTMREEYVNLFALPIWIKSLQK